MFRGDFRQNINLIFVGGELGWKKVLRESLGRNCLTEATGYMGEFF